MSEFGDLGEHFVVGLEGTALTKSEAKLLRALNPLGVILFAKNFEDSSNWQDHLAKFIEDIRNEARGSELLLSIDHEGGRVHRFPNGVTQFPPASTWKEHAREVGRAMGEELGALDFDLSFAPVLDVHSEESNPVIGTRALASDPQAVAERGALFIEGLESTGVLSCMKHFPGHGATTKDSHLELPSLMLDKELLRKRELVPFESCFGAQPQLLMSAHVLYPILDADNPATVSSLIMSDLLRDELKFQGTVISDDLEMKAIEKIPAGERACRCIAAGIDILLEGHPAEGSALSIAGQMAKALQQRRKKNKEFDSSLKKARVRIQELIRYRDSIRRKEESSTKSEQQTKILRNQKLAKLIESGSAIA